MRTYPQLSSGAVVQFPFRATSRRRTVVNELPDGRLVQFQDWTAAQTAWRIEYEDLSTAEWEAIRGLHEEMRGRLRTFVFFDPSSNLLAWSEEFERVVWVKDPFLGVTNGVSDPLGGTNARLLTNSSVTNQRIMQRVAIPSSYVTAFSVWLRSDSPQMATLFRATEHKEIRISADWRRVELSGPGGGASSETDFGVEIPGGATVTAFGAQLDAQPVPSDYKRSEDRSGIFPKTRFASDRLECWSEGPGRYRAVVTLESILEAA